MSEVKETIINATTPRRVDSVCSCGGIMRETDRSRLLNRYAKTHVCDKCGKQEIYSRSYPFIQWYDSKTNEWI